MPNETTKKIKSAHKLAIVVVATLLLFAGIFFAIIWRNGERTLSIGDNTVGIEIADTETERAHGLCCRDSLPATRGMLFIYDQPGEHKFWMKDTLIPLDMIWINSAKKIIYIEHSVQPDSYPKIFGPSNPAQYVLEVNAGYAKEHSITIGGSVDF